MQIKWRQHEFLLVSFFTVATLAGYVWNMINLTSDDINKIYGIPFLENHGSFTYFRNVLLLQAGPLLLLYFCYLWVRRFISPYLLVRANTGKTALQASHSSTLAISNASFPNTAPWLVKRYAWIFVQVVLIAFLLGPVLNMVFYVQNPYHFAYPESTFFPLLGSHPQPASNVTGGLGIMLAIGLLYMAYAWIRESIIRAIEHSGSRSTTLVFILNRFTAFLAIYFSIYGFLAVFNLTSSFALQVVFFSIVPAAFLVYMCNTYCVLPLKAKSSFHYLRTVVLLLVSTLLFTLLFAFIPNMEEAGTVFLISWAVQLVLVTPVSWLLFQRTKRLQPVNGSADNVPASPVRSGQVNAQAAPMLLMPLVEHMFKQAIRQQPARVSVSLTAEEKGIRFEVKSSMPLDTEKEDSAWINGIPEKLQQLYPGKHQFGTGKEGNEYVVQLTVQS